LSLLLFVKPGTEIVATTWKLAVIQGNYFSKCFDSPKRKPQISSAHQMKRSASGLLQNKRRASSADRVMVQRKGEG